jgi:hypothetical protein
MLVDFNKRAEHAMKLAVGLEKLGPNFTAIICWWCNGTTVRNYEPCNICCKSYFSGNGLLWPSSIPAPDSVAYQVLNAAE